MYNTASIPKWILGKHQHTDFVIILNYACIAGGSESTECRKTDGVWIRHTGETGHRGSFQQVYQLCLHQHWYYEEKSDWVNNGIYLRVSLVFVCLLFWVFCYWQNFTCSIALLSILKFLLSYSTTYILQRPGVSLWNACSGPILCCTINLPPTCTHQGGTDAGGTGRASLHQVLSRRYSLNFCRYFFLCVLPTVAL